MSLTKSTCILFITSNRKNAYLIYVYETESFSLITTFL